MTDQDWEVDGATGGSAAGDDATGRRTGHAEPRSRDGDGSHSGIDSGVATELRPGSQRSTDARSGNHSNPANVVPFPGNWFGSVDELVPVHPEPPASVVEIATPVREAPAASAADASDFWEGEADAFGEVPTAADPQSSIALLRSPNAAKRGNSVPGGVATPDSHTQSGRDEQSASAPRSTNRTVRVRALAAAALVAAVAGVVLATHALTAVRDPKVDRGPQHLGTVNGRNAARVVTQTVTTPVTVTTARPARKHRHRAAKPPVRRKRTGSAGRTIPKTTATSSSTAVSGSVAPAAPSDTATSDTSGSAAVSNQNSTAGGSGAGCAALSPDSGCRP